MRKLGRMVRTLLTAVSLLLFVAVAAAWVRGYFRSDYVSGTFSAFEPPEVVRTDWYLTGGYGDLEIRRDAISFDSPDGTLRGIDWPRELGWRFRARGAHQVWAKNFDDALISSRYEEESWARKCAGVRVLKLVQWTKYGDLVKLVVIFPCWLAAIVFGALPSWRGLVWWRGARRRRLASREGRCGVCGYDLRASPQRCPECGTPSPLAGEGRGEG